MKTKIITIPYSSAKTNYANLGFNLTKPPEPTTYYSVVSDEGQCLAMAIIRKVRGSTLCLRMDSGKRDHYLLSALLVDPKYRSKGIGTKLINHLTSTYKDLFLNVETSNTRAYKLYKKLGFNFIKNNYKLSTPHKVMAYLTSPHGYASLGLTPASDAYLRGVFKPYMELDEDLHCTIMFDKDLTQNYWGDVPSEVEYKAKAVDLKILGEENKSIVVELRSHAIQKRFNDLLALGYTYSFPSLLAHITLQYGKGTEAMLNTLKQDLAKGKLSLGFNLTLVDEQWDILDD